MRNLIGVAAAAVCAVYLVLVAAVLHRHAMRIDRLNVALAEARQKAIGYKFLARAYESRATTPGRPVGRRLTSVPTGDGGGSRGGVR